MKIYKDVRGSMENVASVEVNVDTVYVRNNIKRIVEDDFEGWEYDEIQYDKNEYIEKLSNEEDIGTMAILLSLALSELDMLKMMIEGCKNE